MADPTVVNWIKTAAQKTGADPVALLATSLVENGARQGLTPGDNGTSFGYFQMHRGGALGTHAPAWASTPAVALNRAQQFARLQVHHGKGAAAVQRPGDPAGYAAKVDAAETEARRLLGNATPPVQPVVTQPKRSAPITMQTADHADIGTSLIQSILNSNAKLAGISSIQLPVATPIAPRKTPAPVKVAPDAKGTGGLDATGNAIVNVARKYLGTAYRWGGATPKTGFDCSGLLQWAAAQSGIKIPRTTYEQVKAGTPVAPNQLRPGDAVFFGAATAPHHVGIYVGGGKFIQAPHTGDVVKISNLAGRTDFTAARRYA